MNLIEAAMRKKEETEAVAPNGSDCTAKNFTRPAGCRWAILRVFLVFHVDPKLLISTFQVKSPANKVQQSIVTALSQH